MKPLVKGRRRTGKATHIESQIERKKKEIKKRKDSTEKEIQKEGGQL